MTDPARPAPSRPPLGLALRRGLANRCPICGGGAVFAGYLRLQPACLSCGTPLGRLRTDDAAPYAVIFLVGHLLLPPVLLIERAIQPPMWLHMALWLPLFTLACLGLLRPVKGAIAGLMCHLGITGNEHAPDLPPGRPG
ncbi:MAG: DUF983 domain-containing protein [Rhodovarius sp.]|nr:DUF983 domain-containing protein [Rhodovarius sp.]MDW8315841.1 DUF983 domain-containing protein [Rhodovarius sp.]